MNILFVEDHPALRYSIAREMRSHGHSVHEAASAEAALALLIQHGFDLLLTDVGLPGISGDVFAAEARALQPTLAIVFATGLDSFNAVARVDDGPPVLRKPYTWEALEKALLSAK